jgi:hypothetical protein
MTMLKKRLLAALVALFGHNWITLFGGMVAAASGVLIVCFVLIDVLDLAATPYAGMIGFLVLPGVFVGGLLLVPVGVAWEIRRKRAAARRGEAVPEIDAAAPLPVINLNIPHTQYTVLIFLLITAVNLVIISLATYEGMVFMDSPTFCGRVCHSVMKPEYTAYLNSPHARVQCVECHIGPGAPWFVRSKLSGLGQVLAVTFNTYPRPIPSPVTNLRPARETCEQCHWPQQFSGDKLRVITKYDDDEANTPSKTVLLMHIGGGKVSEHGIHSFHADPQNKVYYLPVDHERQKIARVRVVRPDGKTTTYQAPKGTYPDDQIAKAQERLMDCIDCHNRPTHIFKMPEQELNDAMSRGRIDPAIPSIKKIAAEALNDVKCASGDLEQIDQKIQGFYKEKYADFWKSDSAKVTAAIQEVQAIYDRNVFPSMNVKWGVHPNNLGHEAFPGCYRCHDDSMQAEDGKAIGQDCAACHAMLAWDEKDPEILQKLGMK